MRHDLLYIATWNDYWHCIEMSSIVLCIYFSRLWKVSVLRLKRCVKSIALMVQTVLSRCSFFRIWAKWIGPLMTYSTNICRISWDSKMPRTDCKKSSTITSGVFEVSRSKKNQIKTPILWFIWTYDITS